MARANKNYEPPKPFRFLDLPAEIRHEIYRLLFRKSPCNRHEVDWNYEPGYENASTEYLYNIKEESFVKQDVALPSDIVHIRWGDCDDPDAAPLILDCCFSGPASLTFGEGIALLRTNKQIFAEASAVLYQENGFDFVDEVTRSSEPRWHHPLRSRALSFPAHLVKRIELHIPDLSEWIDDDDDYVENTPELRTLLTKMLREQLVNVESLRLRSTFLLMEASEEVHCALAVFLKAVAYICAEHRLLRKTAVSIQGNLDRNWEVETFEDAWITVELSSLESNNEMAMELSNDDGTIRDAEIDTYAETIVDSLDKIRFPDGKDFARL